jgi:hypothetical protein
MKMKAKKTTNKMSRNPHRMMSRRPATTEPAEDQALPDDEEPEETGAQRRCVVTRQHGERQRMLRFVIGPDRVVVPDLAAKLPGRGIWLSARQDVLETARMRGAFAKAARGPVTLPPDLCAVVVEGLRRRIVETLGMARRAGQAVSGFQKAQGWVLGKRAGLVVQAEDGSVDEQLRFLKGPGGGWAGPVARPLSSGVLGAVFGRDQVMHVAVLPGRLAQAVMAETERLAGLSGQPLLWIERAGP